MDINNNIFFILSITILYLPSIYIQSEYILKTHEKDLGIMIILSLPSIIIYYTYYLKFKISSIILILIFLPAIIISIEYLFEGCGYGFIVTSGWLLPSILTYFGYYLQYNIFPLIFTYIFFFMSIVVYAEYLLKSDIKHDFTMIYILEIPIVASYFTLFLKFNILTIMLILWILPLIFLSFDYLWYYNKYDILVSIVISLPSLIVLYGFYCLNMSMFSMIILIHYIILISDYYIFWIYNRQNKN